MGQTSLPVLNRVGYSMYWNSLWWSQYNFKRNLFMQLFIPKFLRLFLEDRCLRSYLRFENSKIDLKRNFIKADNKEIIQYSDISAYFLKKKLLSFYLCRAWVIVFNGKLIILLKYYTPLTKKINIITNFKFKLRGITLKRQFFLKTKKHVNTYLNFPSIIFSTKKQLLNSIIQEF